MILQGVLQNLEKSGPRHPVSSVPARPGVVLAAARAGRGPLAAQLPLRSSWLLCSWGDRDLGKEAVPSAAQIKCPETCGHLGALGGVLAIGPV